MEDVIKSETNSTDCPNERKAMDLTGKRYNRLTVIRRSDKPPQNGAVFWECKCDCGNIKEVTTSNLINGLVKSCGCLRGGKPPKDLTGQVFGMLTALYPTDKRSGTNVDWMCKCECGNIVKRSTAELRDGGVKSCGCLNKRDITGKRFGKLVALRPTEQRTPQGYVIWECRCDCGNTVLADVNSLRNNRKKSCGCLKRGKKAKPVDEEQSKQPQISFTFDKSSHQDDLFQEVLETLALWSTSIELDEIVFEQDYIDKPEPPQKHLKQKGRLVHPRDSNRAWIALERAGHRCEINNDHATFISKSKNLPYTEPHHLIPLEFAKHERFKNVSLDVPANIVSLCSTCHNQLHYGKDIEQLLKDLYESRKARLEKAGLIITFEELLSMYNVSTA